MARAFGVPVEELSPKEVKERYEHINLDGVTGGVWLPTDGQADPANIALALAKGARQRGALVKERIKVTGISKNGRRVTGVDWASDDGQSQGHIEADMVVNCAGMWGHEVGRMAGVNVPLHACEHFYIVTEGIEGLTQMPVLRVPDECAYYKEDAGKILLGAFEPNAKPWAMNGIPDSFEFDQLPEDFDHFEPILEAACNRMPMLAEAGIHTFFNGPESFTPDDAYHLGLAPEMDNFWVAAGFNSIGIQSAGGAGMALAQWMEDGQKPFDLGDVDISRMHPFQGNKHYLFERSKETLGLLYADHFPYRQKATARGVRRTPFHYHLKEQGAVFGEIGGWERANWFANEGQEREYQYSWKRQNWFENSAAEHKAVRENVGMYDMSSFGKIRVEGPDAEKFLNYICGANVFGSRGQDRLHPVPEPARRDRGGCDRHPPERDRLSGGDPGGDPSGRPDLDDAQQGRFQRGDHRCDRRRGRAGRDGPELPRKLLQKVSPNDFSNEVNPFGTAQEIELGMGLARVHRVTYVGELGLGNLCPAQTWRAMRLKPCGRQGQDMGLKLCGMHMMDSCRIEKGFRHFGHDITCEDNVIDAGLGFAVATGKDDFIGKAAVLERKETGPKNRMVQFKLTDPEPLLFHNEPIIRDGKYVGYLSSGNYGHTLGAAIGMGYVPCEGESAADVLGSTYEIDVCGVKVKAEASLKPMYDPKSERVKA